MAVKAERSGTVVYATSWRDEKKKVGDSAWRGERILEIPDLSAMKGEGDVDESDAGKIRVGQKVRFRLEAHPDGWQPDPQWLRELSRHAEGHQTTLGPYHRSWH